MLSILRPGSRMLILPVTACCAAHTRGLQCPRGTRALVSHMASTSYCAVPHVLTWPYLVTTLTLFVVLCVFEVVPFLFSCGGGVCICFGLLVVIYWFWYGYGSGLCYGFPVSLVEVQPATLRYSSPSGRGTACHVEVQLTDW